MDKDEYYEMINEGFQHHAESMANHCHCCPNCQQIPCDGILAGGLCDDFCTCDEEE